MNRGLDVLSVAVLVFAGCVYSLAALGPRSLKRRVFGMVSRILARLPRAFRVGGWAERLATAAGQASGSCGGCGSCSANETAEAASTPAEVRIPASAIGKRR